MRRPRRFVGRDEELALVRRGLAGDDGGRGVILAGAAGVGKTRLAQEAAAGRAADGWDTELVVATGAARSMVFGAVAHLLPPAAGLTGPAELLARVADALEGRGRERPLLLVVDDGHLLDDGSAALLHHLALRGRAWLLVTVRSGEPCPDALTAMWKDGLATRLEVQPLSLHEVGMVLDDMLCGPVAGPTTHLLFEMTGGNPLFLRELAQAGAADGRLTRPHGVWRWDGPAHPGHRLAELLGQRLTGLAPGEREALDFLAVGEPLSPTALARLAPVARVGGLERAGLVVGRSDGRRLSLRLVHPLYSELVRDAMSLRRLVEVKGGLAGAASEHGCRRRDDLVRVATWEVDSGSAADPTRLVAAARRSSTLFDHALAERLARAAARQHAGPEADLVLADQLYWLHRFEEADAVLGAVDRTALAPQAQADAAVMRASTQFWGLGRVAEAERGLVEAGTGLPPPQRAEVVAHRASIALFDGRAADAQRLASGVLADDGAGERARLRAATCCPAWAMVGLPLDGAEVARAHLHLAGELAEAFPLAVGQLVAGLALAQWAAGQLDDASATADGLYQAVIQRQAHDAAAGFTLVLGRIELARGRVRPALRLLEEAADGLGRHDVGGLMPWCMAAVARARALAGDLVGAGRALVPPDAEVAGGVDPFPVERPLAEAWLAAARGRWSDARSRCRSAAEDAASRGAVFAEVVALHDLARLGDPAHAASRLVALDGSMQGNLAAAATRHAVALAAGDGHALDRAAVDLERIGATLAAAEAASRAVGAHRSAGRTGSALASSARAEALLVASDGARSPAFVPAGEGTELRLLSQREREVAALAATGLTSREIADALVVSVRTVDNQLSRVYAKLGVTSRRALVPILGGSSREEA